MSFLNKITLFKKVINNHFIELQINDLYIVMIIIKKNILLF